MAICKFDQNENCIHFGIFIYISVMTEEKRGNKMSQNGPHRQKVIDEYNEYFGSVLDEVKNHDLHTVSHDLKKNHRIQVIKEIKELGKEIVVHGSNYIEIKKMKNNGIQCTYEAIIGQFFLIIKVLNIQRNAENQSDQIANIGKGSFGIVKQVSVDNKNIAIKKISFNPTFKKDIHIPFLMDPEDYAEPYEIHWAIKEYCLYKICSMLKIGPQLIFSDVYDLVCYNDCIQFQMELCETIQNCKQTTFEEDLKYCTAMLHQLKFVHIDIKPSNIVYSLTLKRYVLTDFGISNSVREEIWEKTQVKFKGSYNYASLEMQQLYNTEEPGFVNLYFNDIHALQLTIEEIKSSIQMKKQNFSRNSMSIMAYQSEQSGDYDSSNGYNGTQSYQQNSANQNIYQNSNTSQRESQMQSVQTYRQSTLQSTSSQYFIKFSNQLNFYLIKSLFTIHRLVPEQMTPPKVHSIIEEMCSFHCEKKMTETVGSIISNILFPLDSLQNEILKIRNFLRAFGLFSFEVLELFEQLQQRRNIPQVNYGKLQIVIKTMKNFLDQKKNNKLNILSLDRHSSLTNFRSFGNDLNYFIKMYKNGDERLTTDKQKIKAIANYCLSVFMHGLTNEKTLKSIVDFVEIYTDRKIQKNPAVFIMVDQAISHLYEKYKEDKDLTLENRVKFTRAVFRFGYSRLFPVREETRQLLRNQISKISDKYPLNLQDIKIINYFLETNVQNKIAKDEDILRQKQIILKFQPCFEKLPLCKNKIEFYTCVMMANFVMKDYKTCEKYNEKLLEMKKQLYFPREDGPEFISIYFYRAALAQFLYGNLEDAIYHYRRCLDNFEDSFKTYNLHLFTRQSLRNICNCYDKLKNFTQAVKYMQKWYHVLEIYSQCYTQEIMYALTNLIFGNMKLNITGQLIYSYIVRLIEIRDLAIKNIYTNLTVKSLLQFPIFKFIDLAPYCSQQTLFTIKKYLVSVLQPYLPYYLNFYCIQCHEIATYSINSIKQPLKALPYLWKYYRNQARLQKDKQFYECFMYYILLLIRSNSTRRAIKELKIQAFKINEQHTKTIEEVFKKLSKLTRQLQTKDKLIYNWIWKERAFEGKQQLDKCLSKVDNLQNIAIKLCYKKILKKLQGAITLQKPKQHTTQISQQKIQQIHQNTSNPQNLESLRLLNISTKYQSLKQNKMKKPS